MSQSEGEADVAQAEDADGQQAQEVEADESEAEVEAPAEPAGTVAESSAYGGSGYRISYSCSRASVCCLCQAKSTDPTPLEDLGVDGAFHGQNIERCSMKAKQFAFLKGRSI